MNGKKKKGPKYYYELEARLKEIIDDVNYRVAVVLVEGIHDEESLRKIGVKRPIMRFCDSMLPTFSFVESIANDYKGQTVLMLFDYDEDGRKLAQKIGTQLEEKGVKIEHFLRKEIADLFVREGVWRIEDAYTLKGKTPY